jgi:PAS domain S-box-containing protein
MSLSDLIDSSKNADERLVEAVRSGADHDTIQKLDHHVSFLVESIMDLHAATPEDINRQLKFFLHRSPNLGGGSTSSFDLQALDSLIDRYTKRTKLAYKSPELGKQISAQATISLRNNHFSTDELLDQSEVRIALFNTDYIYEYTSTANAKFNDAKPEDIVGKHMADIVGTQRFESRAKHYFDNCFGGQHQKYSYFLELPKQGEHLMSCQLTPYRDEDGSIRGAFIVIEDLSEKLQAATNSATQNLVA